MVKDKTSCHLARSPGESAGGTGTRSEPSMPLYSVGDPLSADESALLDALRKVIHEQQPEIPLSAIEPDKTLWEIGYDSLALVVLRREVKRMFGAQVNPAHWLQNHEEHPRIGCFARFLAANGAALSRKS